MAKVGTQWQPDYDLLAMRARARMLSDIRAFFVPREVLEVETPLLSCAGNSDVYIESLSMTVDFGEGLVTGYMQTSPEFAMKRLLASGSGDIYQICKAFRGEELGRQHNVEFTLLEWYRLGMDHHVLMDEVEALVSALFESFGRVLPSVRRVSWREVYVVLIGLDPETASESDWDAVFEDANVSVPSFDDEADRLDFAFSGLLQPRMEGTWLVYDYPASQASLARLSDDNPKVAERFELFVDGVELANGFHELTDASQQRQRFEADLGVREKRGQLLPALDERLLAALEAGLPDCAGVALGLDRLLMLLLGKTSISEVMSFYGGNA